jgi:hypothetical protein
VSALLLSPKAPCVRHPCMLGCLDSWMEGVRLFPCSVPSGKFKGQPRVMASSHPCGLRPNWVPALLGCSLAAHRPQSPHQKNEEFGIRDFGRVEAQSWTLWVTLVFSSGKREQCQGPSFTGVVRIKSGESVRCALLCATLMLS